MYKKDFLYINVIVLIFLTFFQSVVIDTIPFFHQSFNLLFIYFIIFALDAGSDRGFKVGFGIGLLLDTFCRFPGYFTFIYTMCGYLIGKGQIEWIYDFYISPTFVVLGAFILKIILSVLLNYFFILDHSYWTILKYGFLEMGFAIIITPIVLLLVKTLGNITFE